MSDDTPAYNPEEVLGIATTLAKGGIWTGPVIEPIGDWTGETIGGGKGKTILARHIPLTEAKTTLVEKGIDQTTIDSISLVVGNTLLKQLGVKKGDTIPSMVGASTKMTELETKKWVTGLIEALPTSRDIPSSRLDQLDSRLAQLEIKFDTISGTIAERSGAERELFLEAKRVLESQRNIDDDETSSHTSQIARYEARARELELRLAEVTKSSVPALSASTPTKRRFKGQITR